MSTKRKAPAVQGGAENKKTDMPVYGDWSSILGFILGIGVVAVVTKLRGLW